MWLLQTPPVRFTIKVKTNFSSLGTLANRDCFAVGYASSNWELGIALASEGLYIADATNNYILVGAGLVKSNSSDQEWGFNVDRSLGDSHAVVSVYIDNIYHATYDCNSELSSNNGEFVVLLSGATNPNRNAQVTLLELRDSISSNKYLSWNGGTKVHINADGVYTLPNGANHAIASAVFSALPSVSKTDNITISSNNLYTTKRTPKVHLSWSDDGGYTWSSDYEASIGSLGEYGTRAIWRRLGSSQDRVFRISISDKVQRTIIGAVIE
jgi:hypothetical protein